MHSPPLYHKQLTDFYLVLDHTGKDNLTGLAVEAATKALKMAEVDPADIDLVLMCTSTPEDIFGSAPQVRPFG